MEKASLSGQAAAAEVQYILLNYCQEAVIGIYCSFTLLQAFGVADPSDARKTMHSTVGLGNSYALVMDTLHIVCSYPLRDLQHCNVQCNMKVANL